MGLGDRWGHVGCRPLSLLCSVSACSSRPSLRPTTYRHLNPGKPASLGERVPVNVVFIGIEQGEIDAEAFEASLPQRYRPVHRAASTLREKAVPLGLTYTYNYRLHFASPSYEDTFFAYLAAHSKRAPLTHWQDRYNAQLGHLDIDANRVIDGPSVERWLAVHPPPGVDAKRNTIFLIDWYGRKDFRFHVYAKKPDVDSDVTGQIGAQPDTEYYVAWGGTAADDPEDGHGIERRIWFYDLSAVRTSTATTGTSRRPTTTSSRRAASLRPGSTVRVPTGKPTS